MNTQYLKYAFGEIILVVIGILIALQINNWNENRIENNQVHALLESMIQDLKADTTFLKKVSDISLQMYNNSIELLKHTLDDSLDTDELYRSLPNYSTTLEMNSQAFEKIKNASFTNLMKSPTLDNAITAYYVSSTHNLRVFLEWEDAATTNDDIFWTKILNMELPSPFFTDTPVPYEQTEAERKRELLRVIYSLEGRKVIRNAMGRKQRVYIQMNFRKKQAEDLLAMIESYL